MTYQRPKPLLLVILDGWGISPPWGGNAISQAETPNFDQFWAKSPRTTLQASGVSVGLPPDEMGNSEVGHLNLGAGRIIYQDISMINNAIQDGSFFKNPVLLEALKNTQKSGKNLHILGLVSDGGVHSHINHLFALLEMCAQQNLKNVYIHAITDGRDTDPMSALSFISHLENKANQLGCGIINTVIGRWYAMDRDNRWPRVCEAYQAIVEGKGLRAETALKAVSQAYAVGKTDEFIPPTIIWRDGRPGPVLSDGDSLIFFNFRADRAREITQSIAAKNFSKFKRDKIAQDLDFVTMVPYEFEWDLPVKAVFRPKKIEHTLAQVISDQGLKQLHAAETEKYPHVTYFFNGAVEKPFPGEDRILIPSPKVPTYDQRPQMSAEKITERVNKVMAKYDFVLVNFANPDMVGHSGNLQVTMTAISIVDSCLGKLNEKAQSAGGTVIITADHGNAEQMIDPVTGSIETEHTTNLVPFVIVDNKRTFRNPHSGILADVAPTILEIIGLAKPAQMTGHSLFSV